MENSIPTKKQIVQMCTPGAYALYDADEVQNVSNAVCLVKTPKGSGSGFLVGKNQIMTNAHVARSIATCRLSTAEFSVNGKTIETPLDPDSVYVISPEPVEKEEVDLQHLDYAVVNIKSAYELHLIAPLELRVWEKTEPTDAVIIQHPHGGAKKISLNKNKITKIADLTVQYSTDTEYGSSGSPVLSGIKIENEWRLRVYALHRSRVLEDNENLGIKIDAIIADLKEKGKFDKIQAWNPSASDKNQLKTIDWSVNSEPVSLEGAGCYKVMLELQSGHISVAQGKVIEVWNRSGECLATFTGHTDVVQHLIELDDGTIVSGSQDATLRMWDRSGQCRKVLKDLPTWIHALIKLKDGGFVGSSGNFHRSCKWDSKGKLLLAQSRNVPL